MNVPTATVSQPVCKRSWHERFELEIFDVTDAHDRMIATVPVVDGWLQVDAGVRRVPEADEERAFFYELAALRAMRRGRNWFFVHKEPGLRIRLQLSENPANEIAAIVERITNWQAPWLGEVGLGSFFSQCELLDERYRETVDVILAAAADVLVDGTLARADYTDVDRWASFTLDFVDRFIDDRWYSWEALGRFARLRTHPLGHHSQAERADTGQQLHDPSEIMPLLAARLPAAPGAGFGSSVALLQTLNYIFNMWAIDGATQSIILTRARALATPELVVS